MKKSVFLFLGMFSLLMVTCSNPFESEKESEKQSVISEARAYFETNASDLLPLTFPDRRLATKTSSFSSTELTPLWDKAYETNHNGVQFVEVPLASKTQFICVETVKRVAGADPEKRIPCQRLLVITNTTLGKEMYVATLVPSEAYLAQTKNWTVEPRTEKGELLGFSGRVFYSTLKGDCRRGVTYENGVIRCSLNHRESVWLWNLYRTRSVGQILHDSFCRGEYVVNNKNLSGGKIADCVYKHR